MISTWSSGSAAVVISIPYTFFSLILPVVKNTEGSHGRCANNNYCFLLVSRSEIQFSSPLLHVIRKANNTGMGMNLQLAVVTFNALLLLLHLHYSPYAIINVFNVFKMGKEGERVFVLMELGFVSQEVPLWEYSRCIMKL